MATFRFFVMAMLAAVAVSAPSIMHGNHGMDQDPHAHPAPTEEHPADEHHAEYHDELNALDEDLSLPEDLDDIDPEEVGEMESLTPEEMAELLEAMDDDDVMNMLNAGMKDAVLNRARRGAYASCSGERSHLPECQFLRPGGAGASNVASSGSQNGAGAVPSNQPFSGGFSNAGDRFPTVDASFSSGSLGAGPDSSAFSASSGSGSGSRRSGVKISFSHDRCSPAVTHVVREAVEYLPSTVYNTQHLLLPTTKLLTMLETVQVPRITFKSLTRIYRVSDTTLTSTDVKYQHRQLELNQASTTQLPITTTKLHVFTDTRDYFWTKTVFQPFYRTQTLYKTLDISKEESNLETVTEYRTATVTQRVPHVITSTLTSTVARRQLITRTAHQYRYVAVTPSPVTVVQTVTKCRYH